MVENLDELLNAVKNGHTMKEKTAPKQKKQTTSKPRSPRQPKQRKEKLPEGFQTADKIETMGEVDTFDMEEAEKAFSTPINEIQVDRTPKKKAEKIVEKTIEIVVPIENMMNNGVHYQIARQNQWEHYMSYARSYLTIPKMHIRRRHCETVNRFFNLPIFENVEQLDEYNKKPYPI